jgi:Ca2+-transporting ATPase
MEHSVHDILVGDVLHVEPGDMIPADGIFIQGHNLKCDESSATGESDQMKKTGGEEVYKQIQSGNSNPKLDPFLISGSKVLEGVGTYLVTSTGVNSSFGKLMMSLREDADGTPLQKKLASLADYIAYLGGGAATLLFVVLFIRFLAQLPGDTRTGPQKGEAFMDILIVCITLIVVAVPEGLPLAVTLALAFATTRMMKANNLVRLLRACETMGNATTVCSDKTGVRANPLCQYHVPLQTSLTLLFSDPHRKQNDCRSGHSISRSRILNQTRRQQTHSRRSLPLLESS